jgi:hypothetical protein
LGDYFLFASTLYWSKLFFSVKRWKYFSVVLLGGLTYAGINYLISLMGPPHPVKVGTLDFLFARIIGPLFFYTVCILASTMLFLYNEQARQKELYKQMELEKTVAELNMLKLQISPHFLFNTLNNIRWLVRKSHPIRKTLLLNFRKYYGILFMK